MSNPFANWSIADAELHNLRVNRGMSISSASNEVAKSDTITNERDLHSQIFDECRRRGWIALHGSMSERSHRTLGEWDFTLLADSGRVFFLEVKTKSGKLTIEQEGMISWARKLGHEVFVVRSIEEFQLIIK